jgi:hypothetical protein
MSKNKKARPDESGRALTVFLFKILTYSRTPIQLEPVPPPCNVNIQFHYASAFFLVARFAFGAASADADAVAFLEVDLFNLALIEFLLLDTPKEPFQRFPFFDFLSPRPMS